MSDPSTLVSEMVKAAEQRHQENSTSYFAALHQIIQVCKDNASPTCRHDMALDFVRQIAERATHR